MKSSNKRFERVPVEIPNIPSSNFSRKLRKDNERLIKRLNKTKNHPFSITQSKKSEI